MDFVASCCCACGSVSFIGTLHHDWVKGADKLCADALVGHGCSLGAEVKNDL